MTVATQHVVNIAKPRFLLERGPMALHNACQRIFIYALLLWSVSIDRHYVKTIYRILPITGAPLNRGAPMVLLDQIL